MLKSDRSFCNFDPFLPKTFFILKISKRTSFKYLKWKLSRQIHSGAFIKIITQKFRKKIKNPELRDSEFLMKLKLPSCITPEF